MCVTRRLQDEDEEKTKSSKVHCLELCPFRHDSEFPRKQGCRLLRSATVYLHSAGVNGLAGNDLAFPPSPSSEGRAHGLKDFH